MRFHRTGTKHIHHPVVGELTLSYETMDLSADDGLSVAIFTAEPGSASQQALDLLASWTATPDPTQQRLGDEARERSRRASAEGEDVRAGAGLEERDLEGALAGAALADELVHPRLGQRAFAGLVDVKAGASPGGSPSRRRVKRIGAPDA